MQNPDWSDIRVFLEVHRAGTLSGAARALGVYPSTIGRRLDALEASMGTVLFQRSPDGLIPTAAAVQMVEAAELMERQAQQIAHQVSGESAALRGPVRFTTTENVLVHFAIEALAEFRATHPEIEVDLISSAGMVDLGRGEADLAMRFVRGSRSPVRKGREDVLMARRLGVVGIGLYASGAYLSRRGRPATSRDLAGHDLLLPSKEWVPGYGWVREHGEGARITLRSDTISGMAVAAVAGFGICALPSFVAISHPQLERIRPPDRVEEVTSWLVMPRDLRRVARVRALWDFLVAMFDERADLLLGGPEGPG